MQFQEIATARQHSFRALKAEDVVYVGGVRSSGIRVENIVPEVNVAWLEAAILLDMEDLESSPIETGKSRFWT